MRILHVSGDWKWTGPAEPMLRLLLAQRELGHVAELACPEAPGAEPGLAEAARAAGVAPCLVLARGRGVRAWRDRPDALRLRALLARDRYDVLHAWHTRDHALAWRAAGSARSRPRLVRSWSGATAPPALPWTRLLMTRGTDALLCASTPAAVDSARRFRRPARAALGAVDLARFAPAPPDPGVRAALGLAAGEIALGIVARVQARRRFDLLLEAMRRLATRDAAVRLVVIGRGTRLDELARAPAQRLGIGSRVLFAGHRGKDYPDVLRALDLFTFLVPGSDGTCRAVLEAHACGLASVTSRRGALPEIVSDGETGLLVDEDPEALAGAWQALLADAPRRARMGASARRRAERLFAPPRLAAEVDALYRSAGVAFWSSTRSR